MTPMLDKKAKGEPKAEAQKPETIKPSEEEPPKSPKTKHK